MSGLKVDMQGMDEVLAALANMDKQLTADVKGAMEAGGKVVYDRARELAQAGGSHPQVITGALLSSIQMKAKANKGGAEVRVGVFGGQSAGRRKANGYSGADYAWLVENGHGIHHSGGSAAPHPFMEPAFQETQGEAMEAIAQKLREALGL